jgi:uncharacterized membrane protein YidH (DUF202 family)
MDLRDQLAEQRTLLAWVRTGLALMGFGFAVARSRSSRALNDSKSFGVRTFPCTMEK